MYDHPPYTGYCNICKRQITHEKSWIRHLKSKLHKHREFLCTQNDTQNTQNDTQNTQNDTQNTQNDTQNTQNDTQNTQNDYEKYLMCEVNDKFKCKYCDKIFSHKRSKLRHEKKYCKKNNIEIIDTNDYNDDEYNIEYEKARTYINNIKYEEGEEIFYLIGFKQKPNYYKYGMTTQNLNSYIKRRYKDHGPIYVFSKIECKSGRYLEELFNELIIENQEYNIEVTHGNEWFYTDYNIEIIKNIFKEILEKKQIKEIIHNYTLRLIDLKNDNQNYSCKYCNKPFKYQQSLSRHQLYKCKQRPKTETQIINNNTNNTNNSFNTNTQNIDNSKNININIYGKENMSSIMNPDLYDKLLHDLEIKDALELYLKEVFIKEESNRNILYKNLRSNDCIVKVDDDKWEVVDIRDVIRNHIQSSALNIQNMIKDFLLKSITEEQYERLEIKNKIDRRKDRTERISKSICDNPRNNNTFENHKRDLYNIRDNIDYS
jgi:hypothetical protein